VLRGGGGSRYNAFGKVIDCVYISLFTIYKGKKKMI
jgi:hypothetical protein